MILEGFTVKGNVVHFDPRSSEYVDTSFGKDKKFTAYSMKLPFGVIYSIYKKNAESDHDEYVKILQAIKGKGALKFDKESYRLFLKRSAIYLAKIIIAKKADTVMAMDTSSNLLNDLMAELKRILPSSYGFSTFDAGIIKNPDLSQLDIDIDTYRLSDKTVQGLRRMIASAQKSGQFAIKKFDPKLRKTIMNWLKIRPEIPLSKIVGKRVVLIDDYLTSGSTFQQASAILENAGALDLIAMTLLKAK